MSDAMWWDPEANDGAGGWRLRRTQDAPGTETPPTLAAHPDAGNATVIRPRMTAPPHAGQGGGGADRSDPLLLARIGLVLLAVLLGVLAQLVLGLFDFLVG